MTMFEYTKSKIFILCIALVGCSRLILGAEMSVASTAHPWQTVIHEVQKSPKEMSDILLYPAHNIESTGMFAALMAGLIAVDYPTTQFVQKTINPVFDSQVPDLTLFPHLAPTDEYLLLGTGALYGTSLLFGDSFGQRTSIQIVKAMTYSYLYSHLFLKTVFARHRPDPSLGDGHVPNGYTDNTLDFGNFHPVYIKPTREGTAFPSFHFTLAFSVGRVISNAYKNPWLGYSIVAFATLPDFKEHHHWVSDMVAGALIGTMIGDMINGKQFSNGDHASHESNQLTMPHASLTFLGINTDIVPLTPNGQFGLTVIAQM